MQVWILLPLGAISLGLGAFTLASGLEHLMGAKVQYTILNTVPLAMKNIVEFDMFQNN